MCIDTVSLPNVSRYDDISLHLYILHKQYVHNYKLYTNTTESHII